MRDYIHQLRLCLLELGCPISRLRRTVREVAEHREDLLQAELAEGLPPAEAAARAEARLGDPRELAENLMASFRQSSWCGRHPFFAFALLPLLTFPILWGLMLLLNLGLVYAVCFGCDEQKLRAASDPVHFPYWAQVFYGADYFAVALVALLFCVLAKRAGVRKEWLWSASLVCVAYSLLTYAHVSPHNLTVGIYWHLQWSQALMPALVIGLVHGHRWRATRKALRLAAV